MTLADLRTPAFLVNLKTVRRNAARMQKRAQNLGVRLRPHVKTHKTLEGARIQVRDGFQGITVSTLAEARYMREGGFGDITYAFPITEDKLPEVSALSEGIDFHILLDSGTAVDLVEEYAREHGCGFSIYLKVDCGYHRAGVEPSSPEALAVAKRLHQSDVIDFQGILTHAGQSYHVRDRKEAARVSIQETATMSGFANLLRDSGIPCPTVSVGSTPSSSVATELDGIDEIRPGNYLFFDKNQVDIGTCEKADCAATVLSRVVSHYENPDRMLIDAGALALSKDPGATHVTDPIVYGAVHGHPDLTIFSLSQEHGLISGSGLRGRFPAGSLIEIIPNHSCLTAACHDTYYLTEGGRIVDQWKPIRGW